MTDQEPRSPATVGFMDIGTNSIRLLVVRILPNHSYAVLHSLKETVRLGEHEFSNGRLRPQAVSRAVAVAKQFAMFARAAGAEELVAVATAATREAANQRYFLRRLQAEAEIEVHVISGTEEARLIHLGVVSGLHLEQRHAFCIDIGGGSTEVSVGNQDGYTFLASLELGAIRLTTRFIGDAQGPVDRRLYERIRRYVREEAAEAVRELRGQHFDVAIGSSGTIENLAEMASRVILGRPWQRNDSLAYSDLRQLVSQLCALSVEERRNVPGMNPGRADIIIGGAAILETLMAELAISEIQVSERGLRDGLLIDYLRRHGEDSLVAGESVRHRSVLQLGRNCHFNEQHAQKVRDLALSLFDSSRSAGLHNLTAQHRELLEHAAMLHHIGSLLTYDHYQKHSEYMIRHAELLGFDQVDIDLIAAIVLYHRNGQPSAKHLPFAELSAPHQAAVRILCVLLRLAENLDRSQAGVVEEARFEDVDSGRAILHISARQGWEIELWSMQTQLKAFERTFNRRLIVEAIPISLSMTTN